MDELSFCILLGFPIACYIYYLLYKAIRKFLRNLLNRH